MAFKRLAFMTSYLTRFRNAKLAKVTNFAEHRIADYRFLLELSVRHTTFHESLKSPELLFILQRLKDKELKNFHSRELISKIIYFQSYQLQNSDTQNFLCILTSPGVKSFSWRFFLIFCFCLFAVVVVVVAVVVVSFCINFTICIIALYCNAHKV